MTETGHPIIDALMGEVKSQLKNRGREARIENLLTMIHKVFDQLIGLKPEITSEVMKRLSPGGSHSQFCELRDENDVESAPLTDKINSKFTEFVEFLGTIVEFSNEISAEINAKEATKEEMNRATE